MKKQVRVQVLVETHKGKRLWINTKEELGRNTEGKVGRNEAKICQKKGNS